MRCCRWLPSRRWRLKADAGSRCPLVGGPEATPRTWSAGSASDRRVPLRAAAVGRRRWLVLPGGAGSPAGSHPSLPAPSLGAAPRPYVSPRRGVYAATRQRGGSHRAVSPPAAPLPSQAGRPQRRTELVVGTAGPWPPSGSGLSRPPPPPRRASGGARSAPRAARSSASCGPVPNRRGPGAAAALRTPGCGPRASGRAPAPAA